VTFLEGRYHKIAIRGVLFFTDNSKVLGILIDLWNIL